ncbi:hypothetical protein [Actinoplanes rectilineatus]|uniref:hypothetical protein n=1 Tax=Actinoplanes rectilineatus TaxID=113571 RepID=UPI000A8F0A94|nr:hypothetical protein [Actinoplanes rectilineatus]
MTGLNLYTVWNASLPAPIALPSPQTRLWVVAASKGDAGRAMKELGIWFDPRTFGGPVPGGPVMAEMRVARMMGAPAVYAYPMPWRDGDRPVRVVSSSRTVPVDVEMGVLLAHYGGSPW